MDIPVLHAKLMYQANQRSGRQLVHQPGRNPVVTLCQTPFKRHHLAITCFAAVAGGPFTACHMIGRLHIGRLVTRAPTVFHGQSIEVRLDG